MGASHPELEPAAEVPSFRGVAFALALVSASAAVLAFTARDRPLSAQVPAEARLEGTVFVGDSVMRGGIVVLHHLTGGAQGGLDSLRIGTDGSFSFPLPNVPDPARSDVFFASVRHHGVLYFGPAITTAVQLDSLYRISAYDTLLAPAAGMEVALQARSVFFEPDEVGWRVTDLFQLRNDQPRTLVSREDGLVWSHPLPEQARDVTTGEGELAFDAAQFEDGRLVVRAALPPGERLFVVRYRVDSPLIDIPVANPTEALDVLVREPAPPLEVEGLELLDRIELEEGSTYLRYSGADVALPEVRVVARDEPARPRVEWVAALLALLLAGAGVLILRPSGSPARAPADSETAGDRRAILIEIARLDETFDRPDATDAERREYRRRRSELIGRLDAGR